MRIAVGNKVRSFPDFLIVGGARCGTSSLYSHLKDHPEVFMPSLKEPHFFNFLDDQNSPHPNRPQWTLENYARIFESAASGQKIGEASASDLYFHDAVIPTLRTIYGNQARKVKIVIVLRNPIDRAWSYHMLLRRSGYEMDFFDMVDKYCDGKMKAFHDFISAGHYVDQVRDYINAFDSVKVYMFEDLQQNSIKVVRNIFELIGVNNVGFVPRNINTKYNASGNPRSSLSRIAYNILFRDTKFKDFFKHFLPLRWRLLIKARIGPKIMKTIDMPADVHEFLSDNYRESIKSLRDFLLDPAQKSVIDKWLV